MMSAMVACEALWSSAMRNSSTRARMSSASAAYSSATRRASSGAEESSPASARMVSMRAARSSRSKATSSSRAANSNAPSGSIDTRDIRRRLTARLTEQPTEWDKAEKTHGNAWGSGGFRALSCLR